MKILIKISPILHNPLASFVKLLKVNEITFLSNVKMAGKGHAHPKMFHSYEFS